MVAFACQVVIKPHGMFVCSTIVVCQLKMTNEHIYLMMIHTEITTVFM